MRLEGEQVLLRIHCSNHATWHGRPLYEALVERARREHLSGATVLTGTAGYLGDGPVLDAHAHGRRSERPVIVEIVDAVETIDRFLERATSMLARHPVLVTLERAHVVHYRGGESA